jgi:hypothetical protein
MMRTGVLVTTVVLAVTVAAVAAELQERTRLEYEAYVEEARQRFLSRVRRANPPPRDPGLLDELGNGGGPVARPANRGGIIGIHRGLVHHWAGAVFIPETTLPQVLAVSHAYDEYHAFYESIIGSRLARREGDTFHLELRAREGAAGITVVLDIRSSVTYTTPRPGFTYALSATYEVREVKDAGTDRERHQPVGQDSGYLWGASTFTTFTERDGGVFVELETLGLSRRFPPVLGWFLEPIARRLGRKSVEGSLQEFRRAILTHADTAGKP